MDADEDIAILRIIIWVIMFIWIGYDGGYTIDKQYREPGGKPIFINIPDRWKWLFKFQTNTYIRKIVRPGFSTYLLGYLFAALEIILLFITLNLEEWQLLIKIADGLVYLFVFLCFVIVMPDIMMYEKNMRNTYDYDWITYFQEGFSLNPKRRCHIVKHIEGTTYEIALGYRNKRKYLAEVVVPVNVGEMKYAVHVYDEKRPYWIIKNH